MEKDEKIEEEDVENQTWDPPPITIQTEDTVPSSVKDKISNVLHYNNFCGICLDLSDELLPFSSQLQFADQDYSMTVGDLLRQVFGNALPEILFEESICATCLEQILDVYNYIESVKRNATLYSCYIAQLDVKMKTLQSKLNLKLKTVGMEMDVNEGFIILDVDDPTQTPDKPNNSDQYVCDCCYINFASKQSLTVHLKGQQKVLKRKRRNLNKWKNTKVKRSKVFLYGKVKCPQCQVSTCEHEKYLKVVHLQMKMKNNKQLQCPDCSYKSSSLALIIKHVNKEHLKKPTQICDKCGKALYGVNEYKRHLIDKHEELTCCPYCDKLYPNFRGLERHKENCKNIKRDYFCEHCPASFSTAVRLKYHKKKHDGTLNILCCDACNYQTIRGEAQLALHVKFYHHNNTIMHKTPRKKFRFVCPVCNEVLTAARKFCKHMNAHGKQVISYCQVCYICFETQEEKEIHETTREHVEKCTFRCEECYYGTFSAYILEAHVNSVHKNIAPYSCNICFKSFLSARHHYNHMRNHAGHSRTYICNECGANLCSTTGLKNHFYRFHAKQEKPFPCQVCDMSFVTESERQYHIQKHHLKDRRYLCPICKADFCAITNLRGHVKKVHWKSKDKFDYRKLEGISEKDFELLRDHRRGFVEEKTDFQSVKDNIEVLP